MLLYVGWERARYRRDIGGYIYVNKILKWEYSGDKRNRKLGRYKIIKISKRRNSLRIFLGKRCRKLKKY